MPELDFLNPILRTYVLPIMGYFATALLINRFADFIAARIQPITLLNGKNPRKQERIGTIRALIASAIRIFTIIMAILFSLGRFVDTATLVWVVGLFSAAFGLGARPFISDFLTGIMLIFEDSYDVGDKIEIPMFPRSVEGVVERVSLRTTRVRGMDGELFTMPNGDIRLVRNFSRGSFSPARVKLKVPAEDLPRTLIRLEELRDEAMTRLPNLIEPWQVISETGELGETAELTILAKAKFGMGATLRTRLLALLQDELHHSEIAPEESETPLIPPVQKRFGDDL